MSNKYKQYIVFGFDYYYPGGGLNDILKSFDNLETAKKYIKKENYYIKYIVDRNTWKITYKEENE